VVVLVELLEDVDVVEVVEEELVVLDDVEVLELEVDELEVDEVEDEETNPQLP
jgi:hypothetical protein